MDGKILIRRLISTAVSFALTRSIFMTYEWHIGVWLAKITIYPLDSYCAAKPISLGTNQTSTLGPVPRFLASYVPIVSSMQKRVHDLTTAIAVFHFPGFRLQACLSDKNGHS